MSLQRRVVDWAPALGVFVLGILAWQVLVAAFDVQEFLLPKPTAIVSSFWSERHTLWPAGWQGRFEWPAALIGVAAAVALFRFKRGVIQVLLACALAGLAVHLLRG